MILAVFSLVEARLIRESAFVVSRSELALDLDFRGINSEPVQTDVDVRDIPAGADDFTPPAE